MYALIRRLLRRHDPPITLMYLPFSLQIGDQTKRHPVLTGWYDSKGHYHNVTRADWEDFVTRQPSTPIRLSKHQTTHADHPGR